MKFTRRNRLMNECLLEFERFWAAEEHRNFTGDVLRFVDLILSDIVLHKGCYLLRRRMADWQQDPDGEFTPNVYITDRSGHEDFENHLHGADFIASGEPGLGYLALGIALVEILQLKLRLSFPGIRFRVSLSFPVRSLDQDDLEIQDDCRVSFHAVRPGEVIFNDLEGFRHDAVGVLEI